jgi:ABC-2 type transport system permease protein
MSGHRVGAITRRLLQQFRRDHRTLALMFGAPLVILGLLGYLLRGGGAVPAMGVVNSDSGPLGAMVASQLEHSARVSASQLPHNEADARLKSGEIAGYIELPADFSSGASPLRRWRPAPVPTPFAFRPR